MPMYCSHLLKSWKIKVKSAEIQQQYERGAAEVSGGIFKSLGRLDQSYMLKIFSDMLFKAFKIVKQANVDLFTFTWIPLYIFLITSAMDIHRAACIFRQIDFSVIPVSRDSQTGNIDHSHLALQFIFRVGAHSSTLKMMRLWMGFNYYKFKFCYDGI